MLKGFVWSIWKPHRERESCGSIPQPPSGGWVHAYHPIRRHGHATFYSYIIIINIIIYFYYYCCYYYHYYYYDYSRVSKSDMHPLEQNPKHLLRPLPSFRRLLEDIVVDDRFPFKWGQCSFAKSGKKKECWVQVIETLGTKCILRCGVRSNISGIFSAVFLLFWSSLVGIAYMLSLFQ